MISVAGYELQEKMRHNHNIDTYYALRLEDRCKVLIKTPKNPHVNSETLVILQHEFHLLNMIEAPQSSRPIISCKTLLHLFWFWKI